MQYFMLNNFVVAWQFPKYYDLHCTAITKEKLSSHLSVCLQISHPGLNICILCDSVCKINPMKFISNYAQLVLTPEFPFKGNLRSKKSLAQMKEREKWKKKRAITDLNVPNGSRDIPFQSQEFEQHGRHHFVDFLPRFHLNMTSQMQCFKTLKKWKCNTSWVFCLICLKFFRLLEVNKRISLGFKFHCYGNSNENN